MPFVASSSNFQCVFNWLSAPTPQAYLIPPNVQAVPQDLSMQFLNIAGPKANATTCPLPALSNGTVQSSFNLAWSVSNGKTIANVTVPKAVAYDTSDTARAALASDFSVFRQQVDLLESQANGCLLPGQWRVLVDRVLRGLPMRVSECSRYYFNLIPSQRAVDLQPGMRLRVLSGSYQYGGNAGFSEPAAALNGFAAGGESTHTLCSLPNGQLAFGGWLGALANNLPSGVQAEVCGVQVLGALDLQSLGPRRCWRLMYPATFNGTRFTAGDPGLADSVALLGAATLQDLEIATETYVNGGQCATVDGNRPQPVCAFFAGRSIAIPEIQVTINNMPVWVPVGTTLRQAAEAYALPGLNMFAGQGSKGVFGIQLWRWAQNAYPPTPSALPSIRYQLTASTFTSTDAQGALLVGTDGLTTWDIALAAGDSVSFWQ